MKKLVVSDWRYEDIPNIVLVWHPYNKINLNSAARHAVEVAGSKKNYKNVVVIETIRKTQ